MSIDSNLAFGSRLRAHRERRGLTLAALADSLKIKQSLLDELERDDVTRWPPGIYGRALVREYAKLVGLPPDEIVQQFVQLFASGEEPQERAAAARERQDVTPAELRLTFAHAPARRPEALYSRLFAASVELVLVLTTGYAVAVVSGLPGWTVNGIIALTWYPLRAATTCSTGPFGCID
jgi:transcriptional regulator with XRE-family HTH domain